MPYKKSAMQKKNYAQHSQAVYVASVLNEINSNWWFAWYCCRRRLRFFPLFRLRSLCPFLLLFLLFSSWAIRCSHFGISFGWEKTPKKTHSALSLSLCIYRYMDIHRTPHLYVYTYFRLAHMYARQISHRMQCELKARHLENAMCMCAMSHTHKTFKRTQQLRATVLNRFVDNDTSLFAACNLQSLLLLFFVCLQMWKWTQKIAFIVVWIFSANQNCTLENSP